MIDLLTVIVGLVVVFAGGLVQGLTGFGFGLATVPILIIFLPPKVVVPMVTIVSILLTVIILIESRKHVEMRRILPLMISGVIGLPVGTYILKVVDANIMRIVIGIIIIAFAATFWTGYRWKVKHEKIVFAPIGFISGLLGNSTSLSGPPVILFFTNQGIPKKVFRANIIAYFTVLNFVAVPLFALNGLVTRQVLQYALILLPMMLLGAYVGVKLVKKVDEKLFSRIALALIVVAGVFSIVSGLSLLI